MTLVRAPGKAAKGKRGLRTAAHALLPVVLLVPVILVPPAAQAAPKLVLYDLDLSTDPPVQTPNLPLVLDARIGWGGACCYVVYGTGMKAELLSPGDMRLIDGGRVQDLTSPGEPAGTVAAEEGGGETWLDARWTVSFPTLGTRQVTVRVTGTNDFGDRLDLARTLNITIATASPPLFPHRPVAGRETPVLVDVPPRAEILSVAMLLSRDNRSWTRIPMEPVNGNRWMGDIPSAPSGTTFHLHIETVDAENESVRSEPYRVKVREAGGAAWPFQDGSAYVLLAALIAAGPLHILGRRLARRGRHGDAASPAETGEGQRGR
jgi:hypothetical protein